jgi:hypothetical protein
VSTEVTVTDSYGRRTKFKGELLVEDTTDTDDRRKPQWLDIDIWRTEGGSFVVQKVVNYRIVHALSDCARLAGYEVRSATADDTFACPSCNPEGRTHGQLAQQPRVTVDVYKLPEELIDSLRVEGKYTRLSRTLLADLSEQDDRIDRLWNTVVVD